jgi:predicted dehydrogenase
MEAFMYRLHPLWLDVVDVVRSGAIGALRAVQTVFSFHNDDPGNIRNQLAAGGGAMMDIGCYAVNVSRLLFDSEPVTIDALVVRDPASGVDVSTSALLGFDGGHAGFTVSIRSEPAQHVTVLGERGRIEVPIPFNIPEDVPTRFELVRGGDPPVAPGIEEHVFEPRNQYSAEADAFARAIIDGTAVPTDPADAVANMTVIDAVLR